MDSRAWTQEELAYGYVLFMSRYDTRAQTCLFEACQRDGVEDFVRHVVMIIKDTDWAADAVAGMVYRFAMEEANVECLRIMLEVAVPRADVARLLEIWTLLGDVQGELAYHYFTTAEQGDSLAETTGQDALSVAILYPWPHRIPSIVAHMCDLGHRLPKGWCVSIADRIMSPRSAAKRAQIAHSITVFMQTASEHPGWMPKTEYDALAAAVSEFHQNPTLHGNYW